MALGLAHATPWSVPEGSSGPVTKSQETPLELGADGAPPHRLGARPLRSLATRFFRGAPGGRGSRVPSPGTSAFRRLHEDSPGPNDKTAPGPCAETAPRSCSNGNDKTPPGPSAVGSPCGASLVVAKTAPRPCAKTASGPLALPPVQTAPNKPAKRSGAARLALRSLRSLRVIFATLAEARSAKTPSAGAH